jgi:hypothetical protein
MRRQLIEAENRAMLERQRQFRVAADVITDAWMGFPEVQAIALIGSVSKPLWKEVPRFSQFRSKGIRIWHECADLDLALWIDRQDRLGELRRTRDLVLKHAFEAGIGTSVANHQVDVFLIEPGTDRYLGRLCKFAQCPKGKPECRVPGCGEIPFNRAFPDFKQRSDLLAPAAHAMLYRRSEGRLRSALDLPSIEEADPA